MTRSLLALEQSGSPAQEEVASLFRAVHTLKGAAYTVGCAPVGDVAHRIEDLLDAVRDGRLSTSRRPSSRRSSVAWTRCRLLLGGAPGDLAQRAGRRPAHARHPRRPAARSRTARGRAGPVEAEVMAAEPAAIGHAAPAPARPRFVPAGSRAPSAGVGDGRGRDSQEGRPSIRVNLDRLDSLMNLVGELVIARSRLDERLAQIERVNELLAFSRGTHGADGARLRGEAPLHAAAAGDPGAVGEGGAATKSAGGLARPAPPGRCPSSSPSSSSTATTTSTSSPAAWTRSRPTSPRSRPSWRASSGASARTRPSIQRLTRQPARRGDARAHGADRAALRALPPAGPRGRAGGRQERRARAHRRGRRGGQRRHRADRRPAASPRAERRRPRHRDRRRSGAPRASPRALP